MTADMTANRSPLPKLAAFALDLAVNIGAPVVIYHGALPHWGMTRALVASTVPPMVWGIGGLIRNRRLDAIAGVSLAGIALALIATMLGGSPAFVALRDKAVTGTIGLAFLISALIGKPLLYPIARATMARESAEALARFEAMRGSDELHHTVMTMTWVWGLGLVGEVALSVLLYRLLPLGAYLGVGPLVGYGSIGTLALWTLLYRRRRQSVVMEQFGEQRAE